MVKPVLKYIGKELLVLIGVKTIDIAFKKAGEKIREYTEPAAGTTEDTDPEGRSDEKPAEAD